MNTIGKSTRKVNKSNLPKNVDISYHTIELRLLDSLTSNEVGEQQGSYLAKEQIIFLDDQIIAEGGSRAISLVLHELGHAIYYIYNLKDREEEPTVDSFANGYTEVFKRNKDLTKWMLRNLDG
tara:strand:- start:153 stop:521 length:369 start_codon:yes stop_codon:yes gene_type:complete